jgi:DNA-binding transcriptional MocR family regulator
MQAYRMIADEVAAAIAGGRLRPGDRLPTQRRFAREHGIADSTAARVYGELIRRGLAVGEVGRGTFIRAAPPSTEPLLSEPATARVDLELNFPILPDQPELLANSLAGLLRTDALGAALRPVGAEGTQAAREAAADLLRTSAWAPEPRNILCAGSGRQALAAAVATLVPPGQRLGVEELTYPVMKSIAGRLGVELVPLPVDESGVLPSAVRTAGLGAIYLQPTLHNPLGITMSAARRSELADLLQRLDLVAIEDNVNGFLAADALPPLAAEAPNHTVFVDSLSKRIAPGLTLGFVVTPAHLTARLGAALRSGAWSAGRFALDAAVRWIGDGTADTIQERKRVDARARQQLVGERLQGFAVQADARSYHCWWSLPEPWRADTFVAAAARHGIAVSPAAAFAVTPGRAPNAVRLALASPPFDQLAGALETLAQIARGGPENVGVE